MSRWSLSGPFDALLTLAPTGSRIAITTQRELRPPGELAIALPQRSGEVGSTGGEGFVEFLGHAATGFGHVGLAASAASGHSCGGFDAVARLGLLDQVLAHSGDEGDLVIDHRAEDQGH